MKISNPTNTTITDIAPKVVETANGFLLNTQYYTKENLAPVPFEVCDLYGSPYSLSIRKHLYLQDYTWNFYNDEIGILRDSTYENRYYMRTLTGYISGARQTRLVVFEETENGEITILSEYLLGDYQLCQFVDQSDQFIYFTLRSNTTFLLSRMDKKTFAVTTTYSNSAGQNFGRLEKIYSDSTYVFFMFLANQNIYALKLNKATNTTELSAAIYRGRETVATAYNFTTIADHEYKIDANTFGVFLFNAANPEQPIDLYQHDVTKPFTDGFTMQDVIITWNNEKSQIDFLNSNTVYNTSRNFITEFDGVKYLHVAMYQTGFSNANYIPYQGIYTFKIESPTSLVFTGYNQVDAVKQFGGFIYDESKEHLIVAKQNAFQILKFNRTTLKYESTNFEIPGCYCVGLDELQRIWYIKVDSSVHMINMEDAQSVEIKFEKEYYDYSGTSITTYIDFSALNYLGEEFSGTFELMISGPAVFTKNNANVLRFTYDGIGKQQVGITITGASPITIYPKFIR